MNSVNEFRAKPYFEYLLKEYLYPLFKEKGYQKRGMYNWIKITGDIKVDIKLKKSVYNTPRGINFCFFFEVSDIDGNLSIYDEQNDQFLPRKRVEYKWDNHCWNGWYLIYQADEFDKLMNDELKIDLEEYILPILEKINTKEILNRIVLKSEEIDKINYGSRWYIPDEIKFD